MLITTSTLIFLVLLVLMAVVVLFARPPRPWSLILAWLSATMAILCAGAAGMGSTGLLYAILAGGFAVVTLVCA